MTNLKQLQQETERMEALAWLSSLVYAIATGMTTLLGGIAALFSGCIGFLGVLLVSAPVLFFCLLFVVIAALIH